jgi:SpoIID/LytB domain protein
MPAKKILVLFLVIFFGSFFLFAHVTPTFSDELDDINKQLQDLNKALQQSITATKPLESQINSMQTQINGIKQHVSAIEQDLVVKKREIDNGYQNLSTKHDLLEKAVKSRYINSYYNSPLSVFLSAQSASNLIELLAYQRAKTDQDKAIITNLSLTITDLEEKRRELKSEQERLLIVKSNLDEQSAKLDDIVQGAKKYQTSLSNQIAQLSAKQQELLAQKLGSLGLPTSAYTTSGGCSSDLNNGKDPGFGPKFGLFTYGVPHRVGMSQYGAKGRADAGGDTGKYENILSFYYPNTTLSDGSTSTNIHVVGTNEYGQSFDTNWSIEDYVKHIYEIPTSWNPEALKAQAVAARSYALTVTNNGASSICPSQSCQVVKQELNSQAWIDAVNATSGKVLTNGGQPIQAWFSSTAGGYTFGSGDVWGGGNKPWTRNNLDASGPVNSFSDLLNNAYDKQSPWFYCDWGGRSQYSGTAWLKSEELADIVNVILLAKADSSTQNHLPQTDKPNPDGVDTWDSSRVKQELQSRGITPFSSITNGSVDADFGSGRTTTIHFSGDGGSQSFNATDFKNYFNLRAPSNINIVGPLYNIEIK